MHRLGRHVFDRLHVGGESHLELYSKQELLAKATEVYAAKYGADYTAEAGEVDEWNCAAPLGQYL